MSEISLRRYCSADRQSWNEFVAASRNATFLFDRGYMDYHAERFADHSMIALKAGRPVALLPANIREEAGRSVLQSHGGLTYGGWILPARHFDASDMLRLFDMLAIYCRAEGISRLDYRPLPHIYHRMPSQEDIYALFRQGACLTEVNLSCAIDLSAHPGLNTQQRRNLRRAIATEGVVIEEMPDVAPFHKLLAGCLAERHGAVPVHSAAELQMLRDRFPGQIRIFTASDTEGIQAGACVYDTGVTAHTQYLCSTPRGRGSGLLTLLLDALCRRFPHCRYFDFGTSNESHGLLLNEGLYRQKSSLGGSGVAYTRYVIDY